ncbi:MAG: phage protein Gp37 [Pseudomonadota bacterium]
MLAEMEAGLVAMLDGSALKAKLKLVGTLPDLDGDNLVKRLAVEAPAVYVVAGTSFRISDGTMAVPFGLACVARNASGHEEARRGDGRTVGLYQMLEAVLGVADGGRGGEFCWRATGVNYMNDDKLTANGLTVAVVMVETNAAMPSGIDESLLSDFTNVRADFDISPHVSAAEHDKWKVDPPDYSTTKPELQDSQQIQ